MTESPDRRGRRPAIFIRHVTFPVQVGPTAITINRDDRFLVCQPDGRILGGVDDGFFTRDTRFISGYELRINGRRPILLNSAPIQFFSARFEFTNDPLLDDVGQVDRHSLAIRVDRTVSGGVHEDIDIVNYARRPVRLTIEVEIESDFADIFDVRRDAFVRRGQSQHPLVPLPSRAPVGVRQSRFPTRTDRRRRSSRLAAAVRQRSARLHRPDPVEGHIGIRASAGCRSRAPMRAVGP